LDDFLGFLLDVSRLLPGVPRRRPILRDPDDECILEVAAECGGVIVAFNTKDFAEAGQFGVRVQTPGEFLKTLRERE